MPLGLFSSSLDAWGNFSCSVSSFEVMSYLVLWNHGLDLFVTALRLSDASMLICACVFHAICLGIFLVVGLGLGAPC